MALLVRDVFEKDPTKTNIPNDGVAKVGQPETPQQWDVLRHELSTFVCKGEYERGLSTILNSFLAQLGQSTQPAAWVSGFYGSGKSHLVRVLEHLWQDTQFPNGDTARNIADLPSEVEERLRELSTAGKQRGGLWSAADRLSSSGKVGVRLAILAVILRAAGLPETHAAARLVIRLRQEGVWDEVERQLEAQGHSVERELDNMYVSSKLRQAILDVYPEIASDQRELQALIREQYPTVADISNQEFIRAIEDVLDLVSDTPGKRPCALIVLDELHQYIGNDPQLALEVQEAVEACCTHFGSTLLFVATGQSQLAATAQLQKLQGRFSINVHLQDVDIEEVIREIVLKKKEQYRDEIGAMLESASGEIDRQLRGTPFSIKSEDQRYLVADYPLLPSRRRVWEAVLRAVDTGQTGQLRTQLRIVHSTSAEVADQPLGAIISADKIYRYIRGNVLNSGALQREVANKIDELSQGDESSRLRSQLCATIFLIERATAESETATGLRPTAEILADLLVDDLSGGAAAFRQRVIDELQPMVEAGTLERVNDEYHLQTAEGAEWDSEFSRRRQSIRNDDVRIPHERASALREAVAKSLNARAMSLVQGDSRTTRNIEPHYGDQPPISGGGVPVWIPVNWSMTEKQFRDMAVQAGTSSPIVFVHLPRKNADETREALAAVGAAEATIAARGEPSTEGGIQARAGMRSRLEMAKNRLDGLIQEILADARVYQAGGNEIVDGGDLAGNVRIAAEHALDRLYPDFGPADYPASQWSAVARRGREGSQSALEALGYNGSATSHPVCQDIQRFIGGAGKTGADVRKHFQAPPFGWPQDAVDGALYALLAVEAIVAKYEGVDRAAKDLTVSNLSRAQFRVPDADERPTASERISVKGFLRQVTSENAKDEAISEASARMLQTLKSLAFEAGGDPPLPARPSTATIDELNSLSGNRLVKALAGQLQELKADFDDWSKRKQDIATRKPHWEMLIGLLKHASDGNLPVAADVQDEVDAIRANRSLLADPDPTSPLIDRLGQALRDHLTTLHDKIQEVRLAENERLVQLPEFHELSQERRDAIIEQRPLTDLKMSDVSTDQKLLEALNQTSLATLTNEPALIQVRATTKREELIRAARPQAVRVDLPKQTLNSPEEIDAWLAEVGKLLREKMTSDGTNRPVIV